MKLNVENATIEINGEALIDNINLEINDHDHIAIIGKNGAGKTTLLRALIDNSLFTASESDRPLLINKIGHFKIGYLEQIKLNDNITLYEELLSCYNDLLLLEKKINFLEQNLTNDQNILDYTNLMERYKYLGGYTYKKEIETIINKFGFSISDKEKKLKDFFGGERMKISFLKLILSKPDLLILDEPTNHLDITSIEWLEDFLKNYASSFIIVSHDRMFIDNTVNTIYEIEYGEITKYIGNYTKYLSLKKARYEQLSKDYTLQQKEIQRLKNIYERFHSKPTKAKMALAKLKQIEKMEIISKPHQLTQKTFKTNLKNITHSSQNVLSIKNLAFGYNQKLGELSLKITRGKKIGIIGKNGIGKSTLLKTLAGIIKPLNGNINYGYNVKSAYFDQNLNFKTTGTILEEFAYNYPNANTQEIRSALGAFMFSQNDPEKPLNVLSGGEKVRLLLCEAFYGKPNLLFLDEPTNHLDIINKEQLENTLINYPETVLFISHDRYFIKKVAEELIIFDNNQVLYYPHNYEDYLQKKQSQPEELPLKIKDIPKETKQSTPPNNTKKLTKIMNDLEKLNQELTTLNQKLYEKEIYEDYQKAQEITDNITKLKSQIAQKEKEWEELI